MTTRQVHRGSRGRFAGAKGGKAEQIRVGRGYVRGVSVGRVNAASRSSGRRVQKFAKDHKKAVVLGGIGVLGAGVGYAGYNKLNPGTSLKKAGVGAPGNLLTYGGKNGRPLYSTVTNDKHRFTTTTIPGGFRGIKKTQHTVVEKFGKDGKLTPVGYVDSKSAITGGYHVTHTYLTKGERGKGLGKQALAAHASHRPRRTYRADPSRSNMGQGLAKSMGVAGRRSAASKAGDGRGNTRVLDSDWRRTSKADRAGLAAMVNKNTKKMSPNKAKSRARPSSGRRVTR